MRLHRLPGMLAFGATDIGTVRGNNEDNFLLDEAIGLAMVADGMGGHAAGEVASAGALVEMQHYLARHAAGLAATGPHWQAEADPDTTRSDPAAGAVRLLHAAIAHANACLYRQNCERKRPDGDGMGATLTGFWRAPHAAQLVAFHVGDSRMYRLRGGVLEQLTRDQTLYQQALETGMLEHLPPRNMLLQAVGPAPSITPEVRSYLVMPGDVLMLCSDGLHGIVPDTELRNALATVSAANLDQVCGRLIEMAKVRGGRDNITVVLALCAASGP